MAGIFKRIIGRYKFDKKLSKKGEWGSFWNYRKGFFKDTVETYGITKENYKNFISDRQYRAGHRYNGVYSSIIDNKLWLPLLLKEYERYIPQYFYFKDNIGFHHLKIFNSSYDDGCYSCDDVIKLLKKNKKLVFKHCYSSKGEGFLLCEYKRNKIFCNKEEKTKGELCKIINELEDYIVTDFIYQHNYANKVASESLNTLRFLLVKSKNKKAFQVARAFHRFGCNGNIVDNTGSGNGMAVFVDIETGEINGEGLYRKNNQDLKYNNNISHPDSNIILKNVEIPDYLSVKDKVTEIANSLTFLCYMGLDVAITEEEFKIVEINSLPDISGIQYREFSKNDLLKQFLDG